MTTSKVMISSGISFSACFSLLTTLFANILTTETLFLLHYTIVAAHSRKNNSIMANLNSTYPLIESKTLCISSDTNILRPLTKSQRLQTFPNM